MSVSLISLKLLVLDRRIKISVLLQLVRGFLFGFLALVLGEFEREFPFRVFLFNLHIIINLFASKGLVFIFHVEIDLDVDVVAGRYASPAALVVAASPVFIHCSYNNMAYAVD